VELVVLSGVSGSGKTTALHALEDAGYFCIDNLPSSLLGSFLEGAVAREGLDHVALVTDIRATTHDPDVGARLEELRASGQPLRVVFLDSADDKIISRFKETRRRHPLIASGEVKAIGDAIKLERQRLQPIRDLADMVIDTTAMTVHDLRRRIRALFVDPLKQGLAVHVLSFGFRRGLPPEADFVFDVRFLKNPYFQPDLRPLSGLDNPVSRYVFDQPEAPRLLERIASLMKDVLPLMEREGRPNVTVAIGCTGGQHRSVALSESLREQLDPLGYEVLCFHRDLKS
jgi:UPF0042 nucleotide-binding protein